MDIVPNKALSLSLSLSPPPFSLLLYVCPYVYALICMSYTCRILSTPHTHAACKYVVICMCLHVCPYVYALTCMYVRICMSFCKYVLLCILCVCPYMCAISLGWLRLQQFGTWDRKDYVVREEVRRTDGVSPHNNATSISILFTFYSTDVHEACTQGNALPNMWVDESARSRL